MLRLTIGFLTVAVIAAIALFGFDSGARRLSAADGFKGPCNGQLTVSFNDGGHPEDLWPDGSFDINAESGKFALTGPSPIISVSGSIDGEGFIQASGEGTFANIENVLVEFQGTLSGEDPKQPDVLQGEYSIGANGILPGEVPINYDLDCPVKPPTKKYSIHALKIDADTGDPIAGWEINLFTVPCDTSGSPVHSKFTDSDGFVDFFDLQPGSYSVEEKSEPDWNPVTPPCVDVDLPGTAGAAGGGFVACPNDPSTCDSFDSGALVNVGLVGSEELFGITLNGPTVIKRSPLASGDLDSVQTEIIQLELSGTSTEFGEVHVTLASQPSSTGKITEQENDSAELDFPADSDFDIYFEVELDGVTLHNEEPLHLECKIEQIPPELCAYEPPIPEPIQLFNEGGDKIAFIAHAMHIPLPPNGRLVVFENEFKDEPVKKYSILALKLDFDTGEPISNWEINLYEGNCDDLFAPFLDNEFTDLDGYVEFLDLQPGKYSVEEKFDPEWNPVAPPCVDLDLSGTAGSAGNFVACPNPDATSCDSFDSGALVNFRLVGDDELFPVTLNGPTVIKRSALIPGATDKIETEIIQMDLVGSSPLVGDLTVRVSGEAPSLGEIEEQSNDTGELDFPADSFFDVFFELELNGGQLELHNEQPLRLECEIDQIPPELCAYEPPIPEPIPLLDEDGIVIAFIEHAMHIPLPPNGRLVVFENEFKDEPVKKYSILVLKLDQDGDPVPGWEMNLFEGGCGDVGPFIDFDFTDDEGYAGWDGLQEGLYSVEEKEQEGWNPLGETCVDVELFDAVGGLSDCPNPDPTTCDSFDSGALVNVRLANSDELLGVTLNGPTVIKRGPVIAGTLDNIQTEIVQLALSGSHPVLGQIFVSQSLTRPSEGKITEQENSSSGMDFPADSFFDIFFEVELTTLGVILHNQDPLHLECKIEEIPPELCAYEPPVPDPIPLYDDEKNVIAFIEHAMHIPLPPNEYLVVFRNERKDGEVPTPTPCFDPAPGGGALVFEGEGTPNHTAAEQGELCPGESDSWTFPATLFGGIEQFIGIRVVEKTGSINVSVLRPDGTTVDLTPGEELQASHDQEDAQYKITVTGKGPGLASYGIHVCRGITKCDFAKDITPTPTLISPMGPTDTPTPGGSGDANKDDVVNAIDATLVLQSIAGLTLPWPNTDVNSDGDRNAVDVALILQFIAGLIPSLPI